MDANHTAVKRFARCGTAWRALPAERSGGPYENASFIRDTILKAGEEFGLGRSIARLRLNTLESVLDSLAPSRPCTPARR